MKVQTYRNWTVDDQDTWKQLFHRLEDNRQNQAHSLFSQGIEQLGLNENQIPDIEAVNSRLAGLTGWRGIPVEGLEEGNSFYPALSKRQFPIGNFLRDLDVAAYTPAPDIFHDLYGHLPFFTDLLYAEFCQEFGKRASKYIDRPEKLRLWERLFWFTVEFALIETPQGRRIFGAGALSSFDESNYALSGEPDVRPFDLLEIAQQEFKIDEFQHRLFVLETEQQLYTCLDDFEKIVRGKSVRVIPPL